MGCCYMLSHVQLCVTPWTTVHQPPLSMTFPRQEYWSGLLFRSPGDLPNPETEPQSPALVGRFFTTAPPGKPTGVGSFTNSSLTNILKNSLLHTAINMVTNITVKASFISFIKSNLFP